jgi:hypothetical protein
MSQSATNLALLVCSATQEKNSLGNTYSCVNICSEIFVEEKLHHRGLQGGEQPGRLISYLTKTPAL